MTTSTRVDIPTLIHDGQYSHIQHFGEAIGWDLDFRQIDTGPLESRVTTFGAEAFRITRLEFNRAFHQLGQPPAGVLSLGLPDPSSNLLRWNGRETASSVLINFNCATHLDVVNSPGVFWRIHFDVRAG